MSKIKHLIWGIIAKKRYHNTCRDMSLWVFGEWFGERCCDNSMYLANYIAAMHPEIKAIWISKESTDISNLSPQIERLVMDSAEAYEVLSECGVAVVSQGLQDLSSDGANYVSGAISINLWHGVPWKKIGHDGSLKSNIFFEIYKKISDYAFGTDYYVSPSDKYDSIAMTAHGAKRNQIIHAGYPRNSDLYHADRIMMGKKKVLDELKEIAPNINYSNVKIITYMPTFRNDSTHCFSFDTLKDNKMFSQCLKEQNMIIIQKYHFVNQTRDGQSKTGGTERVYLLNTISAQDLLAASDLLVTDYSGAFFDYLILDRPIVYYLYDYDYYRNYDRGLYYDKEDVVAGEEVVSEEKLIQAIIRNIENPDLYKERRHQIRNEYLKYDTANSCEEIYLNIINEIERRNFNESDDPKLRTRQSNGRVDL